MQLSAARIFVDRLDRAQRFYAEQLGLRLKAGGAAWGYAVFDAGAVDLVIEAVAPDAPADERVLVGRFSGLSFHVTDIAASHAAMLAAGVVFSGAPERQPWGGQLATFSDPDGNGLQLVQPPSGPA